MIWKNNIDISLSNIIKRERYGFSKRIFGLLENKEEILVNTTDINSSFF